MPEVGVGVVPIRPDLGGFSRKLKKDVGGAMAGVTRDVDRQLKTVGSRFSTQGTRAGQGFGDRLTDSTKRSFGIFQRDADRTASSVSTRFSKMGSAMSGAVKTGLLGLGGLTAAAGVFGVKTAADFQQTTIAFEGILGSAERAKDMLGDLRKFAAATPFELAGLAESAKNLLAVGFNAEEVIPTMTTLGNVAATLGVGEEGISSTVRALGQMRGKGKASAEELQQISEALPGFSAIGVIAEEMGISTAEAFKQMEKGAIPADAAIEAILAGMADFPGAAGAMERQSKTLNGVISTFKDTLKNTAIDFITPALPHMAQGIQTFSVLLEKRVMPAVQELFGIFVNRDFTGVGPWHEDSPFIIGLFKFRDVLADIVNFVRTQWKAVAVGLGAVAASIFIPWAISAGAAAVATLAAVAPVFLLGAGFVFAYRHIEGFKEVVDSVASFVTDTAIPAVQDFFRTLTTGFTEDEGTPVERFALRIRDVFGAAYDFVTKTVIPGIQDAIGSFVAGLQGIGGEGSFFTDLGEAAVKVVDVFQQRVLPAMRDLFDFISANIKPILVGAAVGFGLLVSPLLTLAAGFVYAYQKSETFRDVVASVVGFLTETAIPAIAGGVADLIDGFQGDTGEDNLFTRIGEIARSTWDFITQTAIPGIQKAVGSFMDGLSGRGGEGSFFTDLGEAVQGLITFIQQKVMPAWDKFVKMFRSVMELTAPIRKVFIAIAAAVIWPVPAFILLYQKFSWFRTAVAVVAKVVVQLFENAFKTIGVIFDAIAWVVTNVLTPGFKILSTVVGTVFGVIADVVATAWNDVIRPVFDAISWFVTTVLAPVFNVLLGAVRFAWSIISAVIKEAWEIVGPIFRRIADFVGTELKKAFDGFKVAAAIVWAAVSGAVRAAWNVLEPIFNAVWGFVKDKLTPVWDVLAGAVSRAWGAIPGIISGVLKTVGGLLGGFLSGAASIADAIGLDHIAQSLRSAAESVRGWGRAPSAPPRFNDAAGPPRLATGARIGAGFKTNGPQVIVGEGRPAFPEYVIPTDPRYRKRATDLWSEAGGDLMEDGGRVGRKGRDGRPGRSPADVVRSLATNIFQIVRPEREASQVAPQSADPVLSTLASVARRTVAGASEKDVPTEKRRQQSAPVAAGLAEGGRIERAPRAAPPSPDIIQQLAMLAAPVVPTSPGASIPAPVIERLAAAGMPMMDDGGVLGWGKDLLDAGADALGSVLDAIRAVAGGAVERVWPKLDVPDGIVGFPAGGANKLRDGAIGLIRGEAKKKEQDISAWLTAATPSGSLSQTITTGIGGLFAAGGVLPVEQPRRLVELANGGIFTRATETIVGEAGPEVVIPLTRPTEAAALVEASGLMSVIGAPGGAGNPRGVGGQGGAGANTVVPGFERLMELVAAAVTAIRNMSVTAIANTTTTATTVRDSSVSTVTSSTAQMTSTVRSLAITSTNSVTGLAQQSNARLGESTRGALATVASLGAAGQGALTRLVEASIAGVRSVVAAGTVALQAARPTSASSTGDSTDPRLTGKFWGDPVMFVLNAITSRNRNRPGYYQEEDGSWPPKTYPGQGEGPLADGGIFRRATQALIGEAGPEVVIPLSRPARAAELVRESGLLDVIAAPMSAPTTGVSGRGRLARMDPTLDRVAELAAAAVAAIRSLATTVVATATAASAKVRDVGAAAVTSLGTRALNTVRSVGSGASTVVADVGDRSITKLGDATRNALVTVNSVGTAQTLAGQTALGRLTGTSITDIKSVASVGVADVRSVTAAGVAAIQAARPPSPPPQYPWLRPVADGGIFRQATQALIGEAGPEVVIPLMRPARAAELVQASGLGRIVGAAMSATPPVDTDDKDAGLLPTYHTAPFDSGGVLAQGWNVVNNTTGADEHLVPAGRGDTSIDIDVDARGIESPSAVAEMVGRRLAWQLSLEGRH